MGKSDKTGPSKRKQRDPITAAWTLKQSEEPIDRLVLPQAAQLTLPPPQQSVSQPHQQPYDDPSFMYELMMANWCGMQMLCEHQGLNISFLASPRVVDATQ